MNFNINLWDYQQEAIDNMYGENGIYTNGGTIAEVILPTGAGKSFVAMQAVINEMNEKFKDLEEIKKNGCVSEAAIGYLAPTNLILYQFRLHMVRFIVGKIFTEINLPEEKEIDQGDIDLYVDNIWENLLSTYLKGKNIKIQSVSDEDLVGLSPKERIKKIVDKNIQLLSEGDLNRIMLKAFPKCDFRCYASTVSKTEEEENTEDSEKTDKEDKKTIKGVSKKKQKLIGEELVDPIYDSKTAFQNLKVDFLITDEAHMGGAKKWQNALKRFIKNNPDTKVLGITATPVRNSDDEDILRNFAKEKNQDEYIAQEIYLLEAMENEMVVTPKVLYFPCLLDETKEYLDVMNKYLLACKENDSTSNKIKAYETILIEMHKAMGMDEKLSKKLLKFSPEEIAKFNGIKSIDELTNRVEWQEIKKETVKKIIYPDGTENPNRGKSIVFVPEGNSEETTEIVVNKFINEFKEIFSREKITSIKPYHSVINTKAENRQVLQEFNELGEKEDSGIVAIVTNKMADQGFHPENIKNLMFMDRISTEEGNEKKNATDEITPKASFFQKIGRGIFGILNKKKSEYKIPVFFDFANNFGRHKESFVNKENGQNLFEIPRNIQYFFELAEIGAKALENVESIKIINPDGSESMKKYRFKRVKKKEYLSIDFIDCSETDNIDVLGFTGENTEKKEKKFDPSKISDKFELLLKVLEELKNLKIDYTQISEQTKIDKEFFSKQEGITEEQIKKFYDSLEELKYRGMQNYEYHIGEALKNFREGFWRTGKVSQKFASVFNDYTDYEKLVDLGIIVVDLDNIPENLRGKVRSDGFIKVNTDMPEHAIGINVKTGTKFNEEGKDEFCCREDGLDDEGYDKTKFNKLKYNKKTKCKYNERYFYIDTDGTWKNKFTGTELDIFGYNHEGIDPETGFDRGNFDEVGNKIQYIVHLWHKKTPMGYSRIGKVYSEDDEGKKISDFHGFESKKTARQISTGNIQTSSGFFRDRTIGERKEGKKVYFKDDPKTGRKLNIDRVDEDGFYFPLSYKEDAPIYNVLTSSPYGLDGKDVKGEYPAEFKIGLEVCKKMLEGQDIKRIQQEYKAKGIDEKELDKTIASAYEHFLMYQDFIIEFDDEVNQLYQQIINNKNVINNLGEISETFKTHMWEIAANENYARERALSFSKIEFKNCGEPIKIQKTVDNSQDVEAEAR